MKFTRQLLVFLVLSISLTTSTIAQWEEVPGFGSYVQEMNQNNQFVFVLLSNGQLYRSNDLETSWESLNHSDFDNVQGFCVSDDLLFIHADTHFYKSTDQGSTWTQLPGTIPMDTDARELVIVNGDVFWGPSGTVFKVNLSTGSIENVLTGSNQNDLNLFTDGIQLWVVFSQNVDTMMSEDGGLTWTAYPQMWANGSIVFVEGKVFGIRSWQADYELVYFENGNNTPTEIDWPIDLGLTGTFFEFEGDILFTSDEISYRYVIATNTWEIYDCPSDDFRIYGGFKRNNSTVVFFEKGVMTNLDGSPHWFNRSTGFLHNANIFLTAKDGILYGHNEINTFFRTADAPIWNPTPAYTPGTIAPKSYRTVKYGDYYYSDNYYEILRSLDLINWEQVCEVPAPIQSEVIVSGDSMWVRAAVSSLSRIHHSIDGGNTWATVALSHMPTGDESNVQYVHQLNGTIYSYRDNHDLFQLDKSTHKMEEIGEMPGETDSQASVLSISGDEMVMAHGSSTVGYSSDAGFNWVEFNAEKEDGSAFWVTKIIISPGGMVAENLGDLYKSEGPGFPFIKIPIPYLDNLTDNTHINSFVYFDGSLYIGLSNGRIFRTGLTDLEPGEFSGRVFIDENENGVFDTDETPVSGLLVNRGLYKIEATDNLGYYDIFDQPVLDSISLNVPWADWVSNPQQYQTDTPDNIYDFALIPPFINNFCISNNVSNFFLPGFERRYFLDITNLGIGTEATVKFLPNTEWLTVTNFNHAPDYYIGDTMVWVLEDFDILERRIIYLDLLTSTDAPIDGIIKMYGEVQSMQEDEYPSNNIFCEDHIIRASYDPNDKQVDIERPLKGETLTYTVRFQNTGNFPASFVTIQDTLSEHLDLRTAQIISSSHEVQLEVVDTNILHFVFDPIFLPDSISNELESHGYVKFSVSPFPETDYGAVIENSVGIYFDFNAPVITNTITSIISKPTSLDSTFLTFCEGELYQGITLFADTLLYDTLELADEIQYSAIFLTVEEDLPDTNTSISIVQGEQVFGIPIYTDTTIIDNLQNIVGCDSIVVINVMVVSSTEEAFINSGIQLYPVLVKDELFINWSAASVSVESVSLIAVDGRVVDFRKDLDGKNELQLVRNNFGPGVYFCLIESSNGVLIRRVIFY